MEHVKDTDCKCDEEGVTGDCTSCVFFICTVCGGAEGTLPTDCPGKKMGYDLEQEVGEGIKDYRCNKWVTLNPAALSAFRTILYNRSYNGNSARFKALKEAGWEQDPEPNDGAWCHSKFPGVLIGWHPEQVPTQLTF